jgi:hypothetical protein
MRSALLSIFALLVVSGSTPVPSLPAASVAEAILSARADEAIHAVSPTPRSKATRKQTQTAALAKRALLARSIRLEYPSDTSSEILPVVAHPDIREHHQRLASQVLRAMPAHCLSNLERFYVRYDNPKHRGLASKSSIILDGNVDDTEFMALLVHEFGHVADLGCVTGGRDGASPSAYKDGKEVIWSDDPSAEFYAISWRSSKKWNVTTKKQDFVSGYAAWDPFEDFAESFAYYLLHRESFEERAEDNPAIAAKLAWFQKYMFSTDARVATGGSNWTGVVPWDVTKLPFTWNATNIALR